MDSIEIQDMARKYHGLVGKLCEGLRQVMTDEIIPQLRLGLPEGYDINEEESEILLGGDDSPIEGINLHLRAEYQGKPIFPFTPESKTLTQIQNDLDSELERLSKHYGVDYINIFGNPHSVG